MGPQEVELERHQVIDENGNQQAIIKYRIDELHRDVNGRLLHWEGRETFLRMADGSKIGGQLVGGQQVRQIEEGVFKIVTMGHVLRKA